MNNPSFFNFLDYIYITIMLISSAFGFTKGFTRSFLSLCAWVCSGFLSVLVAPYLYPFMEKYFKEPSIIHGVSTIAAYIFILIALILAGHFISDRVKRSVLSGLDRSAGLLFGLLRGVFLPFCICSAFLIFNIDKDRFELINESKISHILFTASEATVMHYLEQDGSIKKSRKKQKPLNNERQKSIKEALQVSKFKIIPKQKNK